MTPKNKSDIKKSNIFQFIDEICVTQSPSYFNNLSMEDKKLYKTSKYMINRFVSMNPYYTPIVNYLQRHSNIPDKLHYLFLSQMIPKKKQFNKYIKKQSKEYDPAIIKIVSTHFKVSFSESCKYIDIYYSKDIEGLKLLCRRYGMGDKEVAKIKI
jgi:hypothetical protein